MKQTNKMIVFFMVAAVFATLTLLVAFPSQKVSAIDVSKQTPQDCMACHEQAGKLWETSHHRDANVSCVVCHKLADTSGVHPDTANYTVESQESTCLVCHAEVAGKNIAGQMTISQHGKVGLTCTSCHEQHSQGLKLAEGSRTVCENCHKAATRQMLESTHFAAGLSCVNCHMGDDKNHTLIVSVQTCGNCHTDLHEAKRMLDAGLEIKRMDNPAAMVTVTPKAEPVEKPVTGGISMPSWTLVLAGMLIGSIIAWVLIGKDPGKPSNDE